MTDTRSPAINFELEWAKEALGGGIPSSQEEAKG